MDKSFRRKPSHKKKATDFARSKINSIYRDSPGVRQELEELRNANKPQSKHQRYVRELTKSGISFPEIQTAWHNYYLSLSENEKNEVWQEFYDASSSFKSQIKQPRQSGDMVISEFEDPNDNKSVADIKTQLLKKVDKSKSGKWNQRGKSLLFGLGLGFLVLIILLFGFFNDRFLAPFVTPSRNVNAQSLILDPNSVAVGPNPTIIIPKINVEIPVIYTATSIDPNVIENSLEDGVVHYPTTPYPGQNGNGAIFGHSSNNILNPGKYKFAFVLLHDLQPGDTFDLTYNSKLYVYEVYKKSIVSPSDVSVLSTQDQPATFSLITCDPPGTSLNRLVVVGKQISPDPLTNTTSSVDQNNAQRPTILPSNSQSLWSRLFSWL